MISNYRPTLSATLATAAEAAAGTDATKVITPATLREAMAAIRNALAAEGGVAADGTTGTKIGRDTTTQSFAANDLFCLSIKAEVPSANPSANRGLMGYSDTAGSTVRAGAVNLYLDTAGYLIARFYGATTADYRQVRTPFVGTYLTGSRPLVHFDKNAGKLYINANDTAATETTGGTPPAWTDAITGTIYTIGTANTTEPWVGALSRFTLWNAQPDATARLECLLLGGTVPARYKWASQAELVVNGDFASGTGWGLDGAWTVGAGVATAAGIANNKNLYRTDGGIAIGVYRFVFTVSNYVGGGVTPVLQPSNVSGDRVNGTTRAANGTFREDLTVPADGGGGNYIQLTSSGTTTLDIDNVSVKKIGAVAHLPLNDGIGYQLHDESTNNLDAVMSTTGFAHISPKRDGYIRSTLTWAGTHEAKSLLGQRCTPNEAVITLITTKATVASSGSGLVLSDSFGGARFVAANTFTTAKKPHTITSGGLPGGTTDTDNNLTLDPDTANYTGSIQIEVRFSATEGTL